MKKLLLLIFITFSSQYPFMTNGIDDLFSTKGEEFKEWSIEATRKAVERPLHPFWDSPTYAKLAAAYFYYTFLQPLPKKIKSLITCENKDKDNENTEGQ